MYDVEKLQSAKEYLDLLSQSIDPTTREHIDDPILQKEEIKDVLRFASEVLSALSQNGITDSIEPSAFDASTIDKSAIGLTDRTVGITSLAIRINKQVDKSKMRSLRVATINEWLVSNGYLSKEKVPVVRNVTKLVPTDEGSKIGLLELEKINRSTGEITKKLILSVSGQQFIIDHLDEIAAQPDVPDDDTDDDTDYTPDSATPDDTPTYTIPNHTTYTPVVPQSYVNPLPADYFDEIE